MQEVVAVDIGNSAIKLAARSGKLSLRIDANCDDQQFAIELSEFCSELKVARWQVCCVDKGQADRLGAWVAEHRRDDAFELIAADDIPLKSQVADRERLGRDRLLAAWYAAEQTDAGRNAIVVDGGTAITIDVVTAEGVHLGGLIFPGPQTTLASLSEKTAALPNLSDAASPVLSDSIELGTSTETAILLGAYQCQLLGTIAIVESLEKQHATAQIWCCGGVLAGFQSMLPPHWNFRGDFVTDAIYHLVDTDEQ